MKAYLRDKHKTRNLEQLKEGIRTYWKTLTSEVCTRYIDHLLKVMPVVVQEDGAPQDIEQFVLCVLLHACKQCHVHYYLTSVAVKQTLRWDCMTPIARWGYQWSKQTLRF